MTAPKKTERLNRKEAEQFLSESLAANEGRKQDTLRAYAYPIRRLLAFLEEPGGGGRIILDPDRILDWMAREAEGVAYTTASCKYQIVSAYFRALAAAGRIEVDPTETLRGRFGRRGWTGLAQALQSADRQAALDALRPDSPFGSVLGDHLRTYLELKRSLGAKYHTEGLILAGFDRFLRSTGTRSPQAISSVTLQDWLRTMRCAPRTRAVRVCLLERFFSYLQALSVVDNNPVEALRKREGRIPTPTFRPYHFTPEEVAALLREAKRLQSYRRFPLRPQTFYTIIALLYALGLRIGEACRIQVQHLDLHESILSIRETKFFKSRLLPFGPRLRARLVEYLGARSQLFQPLRPEDPLFVTFRRRPVSTEAIHQTFPKLLEAAGIAAAPGRRRPRPHDLRHGFALQRLLRWYRDGVDVQARLPRLSTFLGHVDIQSTQVYLNITPDLLDVANRRFWEHFGSPLDH